MSWHRKQAMVAVLKDYQRVEQKLNPHGYWHRVGVSGTVRWVCQVRRRWLVQDAERLQLAHEVMFSGRARYGGLVS